MFKNRDANGYNNICGKKLKKIRENLPNHPSQRKLADILQLAGLDIDKNTIQRIECGKRFVTDIEIKAIAKALHINYEDLLDD